MTSAKERWGEAALRVAQVLRQQSPLATRGEVVHTILKQVPLAPRGRRSLEVTITNWIEAGELPAFVRAKGPGGSD